MAQALAEIMAELDPQFSGQKALIATQQAALPGQAASEYAGLDTAKVNAFQDATNGANSRGVLYSGAPIDEQNRYVGEKYLPARAAVASDYQNRGFKLQEALLGVTKAQGDQAYAIRSQQQEQDRLAAQHAQDLAEQQRQFDQQQAAARQAAARAASGGLNFGALSRPAVAPAPAAPTPQDHLMADIQQLIPKDYATRFNSGYTERQIQRLQAAYKELDPNLVKSLVYQYRKQVAGN